MRKFFASVPLILMGMLSLSGCGFAGDKSGSLLIVYSAAAVLSLLLLAGCLILVRNKRFWFITLFSSVLIVNVGYTLLAASSDLNMALWANRISYLGSVFLPLSMLMILLDVTDTPHKKNLPKILFGVAVGMFLIAASPGILTVYYQKVFFAVENGVSMLIKEYGPLHFLYLIYLLGYFTAMVAIIVRANIKKTIDTTAHAIVIAIAVFVNIGVWFIEQLVNMDFEMLSVSYIISELFLLGVHLVMNENRRLREIVRQVEKAQHYTPEKNSGSDIMLARPIEDETVAPEQIELFLEGLKTLTPSEKTIYDAYIARVTTKEIMATMNIKESTLKYHSRNLYGKLGVSTRRQLQEVHKHIRFMQTKLEETDHEK